MFRDVIHCIGLSLEVNQQSIFICCIKKIKLPINQQLVIRMIADLS